MDDFKGQFCCQGPFPLIKTVLNVYINNSTYNTNLCCNSEVTTTTPNTIPTTTIIGGLTTIATTTGTTINYGVCVPGGKLHIPHPTDCNKFIKCEQIGNSNSFNEYIGTCQSSLLFNPSLEICDWPQNVICKTVTSLTQATTQSTIITTSTVIATTTKTNIIGCNIAGRNYGPHPTDCTKMISCISGLELSCAIGLYFDYTTQSCVTSSSNCNIISTSTILTTTTTSIDYSKCPSGHRFSPHATNCSKFLQCERSTFGLMVEYEVNCPNGLLFNSINRLCDWPQNVQCSSNLGTTTVASTTVSTATVIDYSKCPSGSRFSKHPTDCSKYVQCDRTATGGFIETVLSCPSTLLFNNNIKMCDLRQNVVCEAISVDYTTCPSGQRFSPHSSDCSKYMQCEKSSFGLMVEYEVSCSSGLLYNSNTKSCDFPQNVICKSTTPTSSPTEYICLRDGTFPSPVFCNIYYRKNITFCFMVVNKIL